MGKYPIHPAAALVPPMPPDEYEQLKQRIAEFGLIWPIVVHKGKIVDGRHRQRACEELGIDPVYQHDDELLEHGGDVKQFVFDASCRRNLTPSQKAMLAAELLPAIKPKRGRKAGSGLAQSNKKGCNGALIIENGKATEQAAEKVGVAPRTVAKAKNVSEKGCKQLQQAVRDGRIDVTLAEKVVKSLDGEKQEEVVAAALASEKPDKELRAAVKPERPEHDFRSLQVETHEKVRRLFSKWPRAKSTEIKRSLQQLLSEDHDSWFK